LAAKLEARFATQATLIEGSGGIFDVTQDGALVYSKHATGKFPDEEALIAELG
jgi:selT/selW/selH-like putative selenoprotein